MAVEVKYEAEGTAWGGREGRAAASSGRIDLQLSVPKELGGPGGEGSNPEELFSVGYAACFHSALKLVAARNHVDVSQSAVTVRVGIGTDDADGGFGLQVHITGELPGIAHEQAMQLLEQAHAVCPYSKATRGNIEVELSAVEG